MGLFPGVPVVPTHGVPSLQASLSRTPPAAKAPEPKATAPAPAKAAKPKEEVGGDGWHGDCMSWCVRKTLG